MDKATRVYLEAMEARLTGQMKSVSASLNLLSDSLAEVSHFRTSLEDLVDHADDVSEMLVEIAKTLMGRSGPDDDPGTRAGPVRPATITDMRAFKDARRKAG